MKNYIVNKNAKVKTNDGYVLENQSIINAINFCNDAISNLYEMNIKFNINIFEILGMRNLSGFVGEYFSKSVAINSNDDLTSNMHQDGYPDLLLINTTEKKEYLKKLYIEENGKKYPISKELFSPFKYGGIEIKATCGSTPSASANYSKPLIGERRINDLKSFDWKAHHRQTNNLLAVLWDFIDEIPTIVACFYSNNLTTDDWGKIVQPKEDGGRTTSVSIMGRTGIRKMCDGWIAVIDDPDYINALSQEKWIGNELKEQKDANN